MKNKKRWLSLVLAAAMAATALTGCGKSSDDKSDSAGSDSKAEVFKIGGIGPITGWQ